jgi:NADPH:quinone reductase-like Zn-dependent oxidoreductase
MKRWSEVCATSLNPVDYKVAAQGYDGWRYPHVLGVDVAGDLPYSISIHDIGLGGVMASPAFRRRQEDLGRMATELMALVKVWKIRPTVAEQITLEAIPKALERLAEGHVRGKIVAEVQS